MSNPTEKRSTVYQKALFLRDFLDFSNEMDLLFGQEDFLEVLNEYYLCEIKIESFKKSDHLLESYIQIRKELRIELINYMNQYGKKNIKLTNTNN